MGSCEDQSLRRKHLVTAVVSKPVDRVEVHQIIMPPNGKTGLHTHAGGTAGVVLSGDIAFQVQGEALTTLHTGDTFCEPAGRTIERFDNLSSDQQAVFIAFYPLAGDESLITMLRE